MGFLCHLEYFQGDKGSNMELEFLYYGTDIISAKKIVDTGFIDVQCGNSSADFGPGFYTTNSYKQAEQWAQHKAKVRSSKPAVVKLLFDKASAEPFIERFQDDLRWGRFIVNNRNGLDYVNKVSFQEHNLDHRYQITIGRIADVSVLKVVNDLRKKGIMLNSLTGILNPDFSLQIVFHTQFAVGFIKAISYECV